MNGIGVGPMFVPEENGRLLYKMELIDMEM